MDGPASRGRIALNAENPKAPDPHASARLTELTQHIREIDAQIASLREQRSETVKSADDALREMSAISEGYDEIRSPGAEIG